MASLSDLGETLQVNGCGLRYWNHGEGGPVVLTHGAGTDHTVFDPQVRFLVEAGHRVITWDRRGTGQSVPWDGGAGVDRSTEDLARLLETLSVVRPVLIGQGLGGTIVQEYARRYPNHVRALVVIGAGSNAGRVTLTERLTGAVKGQLLRRMPPRRLRRVLAQRSATTRAGRTYAAQAYARMQPERLLEEWTAAWRFRTRKRFYRTPVPLRLVRGEADHTGTVVSSMRRWAPRELTRQVVIPDAGHLATLDAPEAVNAVLADFLEDIRPAERVW
ncbi:alpha/beta fold hydrolase [Georgenia thermotolerans]|uniref:Alpha/beta fold hydrolase n=1 Tax=Georgenia thermotolerans TaxID=527326 RepID=A0A7J5UMZ7_9MICO|nr:alpha/beta hydrolase [Georgenia thermotolerans]KAE8763303.1 alpha/beta fold hydrolase [Georgenia thermotolerans]